jgi:hypothetical protein
MRMDSRDENLQNLKFRLLPNTEKKRRQEAGGGSSARDKHAAEVGWSNGHKWRWRKMDKSPLDGMKQLQATNQPTNRPVTGNYLPFWKKDGFLCAMSNVNSGRTRGEMKERRKEGSITTNAQQNPICSQHSREEERKECQ